MKLRESHMPEEKTWRQFFDPDAILLKLGLTNQTIDVVDFGCGYGTFSIPAARIVSGVVYALDIDAQMVAVTNSRAAEEGLSNLRAIQTDLAEDGAGLPDECIDYAMLFNLLHCEDPVRLLQKAYRVLRAAGTLAIIHWNKSNTPRGPSRDLRPTPQQCMEWAGIAGFPTSKSEFVDLPPYHFGLCIRK